MQTAVDLGDGSPRECSKAKVCVFVDVAISEVIGKWQVGVAGYYARQIADDQLNAQPVPGGNRFANAAVGPVIAYNIPACKCSVKFKAQMSVFTRNSLAPNAAYLFINKAFM